MKRLIIATCFLLSVIGVWLVEAQVPIVRPPQPSHFTLSGAMPYTGPVSLTGNQTIGADAINSVNWNKVIDPRTYGCHGDLEVVTNAVPTSGLTTLTSASNPWLSTDCNVTHGGGCTGATDKVIRVDDSTVHYEVFVGTVVGFATAGSITLSSAPTVTNGDTFQASWATADDACLSGIGTALGSTGTARAARVLFTVPIAMTTTWSLNSLTGRVEGSGCSMGGVSATTSPASPFIWFGTTPDIPMLQFRQSYGMTVDNMCLIGGSLNPPSYGINFFESGGDQPNVMNVVRDTSIGSLYQVAPGNFPPDRGQVFVGTPSSNITTNSITLSSTPTTFSGPGPNQLILIVDTSAGATEGNEMALTASGYTRGANPITLSANVERTHTAANTVVLLAQGTVTNGVGWDPTSLLNDKNKFENIRARDTDVCFSQASGQATGGSFIGNACATSLFGFFFRGGNFTVTSPEFEGVGVLYAQTNTSQLVVTGDSSQLGGGASYGPNFLFTQVGGSLERLTNSLGGTLLTRFTCLQCFLDESSAMNANGDFVNFGSGVSDATIWENLVLGNDANGRLLNTIQPSLHTYQSGKRDVSMTYSPVADQSHHVVVTDAGGADNQTVRVYNITRQISSVNATADSTKLVLRGTESASDVHNRQDGIGWLNQRGAESISPLDATQSIIAAACTGASGGATDYWYRYAYSVNGYFQKVNTTGLKATCVNAPSVGTPVTVTAFNVRGADTLHIYQASCADPCADPGSEVEVANAPVNSSPSTSFNVNSVQDTGASIGTAMPTKDATGGLHRSTAAVANLPATCVAGDTQLVQDWNGTNGACTGGGTNYVEATCGASNNWFCP